jgi:sugar lactone lactonase YvrE
MSAMNLRRRLLPVALATVAALVVPSAAAATSGGGSHHHVHRLVAGLAGGSGSTVGPGGALYVTEPLAGRISRVDPRTGAVSTFATGLPPRVIDVGGAMDVAFLGRTAYVLVTLVGPDVGGTDVVGVYRMDGPRTFSVVADIGAWSVAHPPDTAFFVPTGVQYAMQADRGGILVTDGHHNRVLRVTRDGGISEVVAFGNVVPTGLDTRGGTVYMAQAGPVPHLPRDGRIAAFRTRHPDPRDVASGGRLLVDVEFGRGHTLYALAQGVFDPADPEGAPAQPGTGKLLRARHDGTFGVVADRLDRPTSLELIRGTAYVVTLTGEIWTVET